MGFKMHSDGISYVGNYWGISINFCGIGERWTSADEPQNWFGKQTERVTREYRDGNGELEKIHHSTIKSYWMPSIAIIYAINDLDTMYKEPRNESPRKI